MFEYLRNVEGNSNPVMIFVKTTATAANQPKKGDAVTIASGLAQKAVAASDNILGIAKEDTVDGEVLVIVDRNATYRVSFVGTSKTTLADTDLFGQFDLKTSNSLDLDASTKDHFTILEYDNTAKTAVVINNKPIL